MPLRTFLLRFPNCLYIRILRPTQWTHHPLHCLFLAFTIGRRDVKTALVEAVFAEEMNRWKVKECATGRAARCVEG